MSDEALDTTSLTLFLDVGSHRRRYMDLKGSLRDLIPNPDAQNAWRVGFRMDENLLFCLVVVDKQGEEKVTPLGDLQEKLSGLHISDF